MSIYAFMHLFINIYSEVWGRNIVLNVFLTIIFKSLLFSQKLHYIIKNAVKQFCEYWEMLLLFKITAFYFDIFKNGIYSCDGEAGFPVAITQSYHLIIQTCWFGSHLLLLSLLKTMLLNIFVDSSMSKK